MDNENKTAQTTEQSGVDVYADVNKEGQEVNEADFSENAASEQPSGQQAKPAEESPAESKRKQTDKQNSENARRRRENERQAELKAARVNAVIEALGGKNPYTNEEIKDEADVEEFLTMKQIETSGGDPLADYSKYAKRKAKEAAEKQQQEEQTSEWYRKDKEEFIKQYPDVKLDELIEDEQFRLFAEGKVGTKPLASIYADFAKFKDVIDKEADQRVKKALANKAASPGALSTSESTGEKEFFTRDEVAKMSQDEVKKNFEKIRKSMSKW